MIDLEIRPGSADDLAVVLELFDDAIRWLTARGLAGQWGEQPLSTRPEMRERVRDTLAADHVRIAEHEGQIAGVLAAGQAPPYVPPVSEPELYVVLLLSARRWAGNAIGARLLGQAAELARARGAERLRVDCWADSPRLVRFYLDQGFARDGRFDVNGWRGQILSRSL